MVKTDIEERIERAFSCDKDAQAAVYMVLVMKLKLLLRRTTTLAESFSDLGLSAEDFQQADATVGSLLLQSRFGPDVLEWLKK